MIAVQDAHFSRRKEPMKKLLAMLLSLAMLLALVPATLADDADFTLSVEGGWVDRNLEEVDGEKLLKVDVKLSGTVTDPVCGMKFALTYNAEQITLKKYEANESFGTPMINDTAAGKFTYASANTTSVAVTDEMTVVTLYFALAEGLETGDEIEFALESGAYVETGDPKTPAAHDLAADLKPYRCFDATFSLFIPGGKVSENLVAVDGQNLLAVEVSVRSVLELSVCSMTFDLHYDPAQLTFVKFEGDEAFGAAETNANTAGLILYTSANANGVAVRDENLLVGTFYFAVAEDLPVGTEITFELSPDDYVETGSPAAPDDYFLSEDFTPYVLDQEVPDEPIVPSVPFNGTVAWAEGAVEYKGQTPYVIWDHAAGKMEPAFVVLDENNAAVDPENYDFEYKENVYPGTGYLFVTFKNAYSGEAQLFFKIYLPASEWLTVENVENGILLNYAPVEDAAGYVIYRRAWSTTTNGWTAFARWDNTTETHYLDGHDDIHKTYAGTRYQYGVKAYFARRLDPVAGEEIGGNVNEPSGNYNLGIVSDLKTTVRITTRTLNSVTGGTKQVTAKWGASKNFTGYEVQIATDEAFTKNVKTVKITDYTKAAYTFKNLQAKTTYYVRVRSYHVFEGTTYYGGWSNVLNAKTK
jgi:hypothetical protein